jgi:hypothetical protein
MRCRGVGGKFTNRVSVSSSSRVILAATRRATGKHSVVIIRPVEALAGEKSENEGICERRSASAVRVDGFRRRFK